MDEAYYRQKIFDIRLKIAILPPSERENKENAYYQELYQIKKEYKNYIFKKKEMERVENDKHKRK